MPVHITPEQYLEIDRNSPIKYEYYTGELEPVAPPAWVHGVVLSNIVKLLSADAPNGAVVASGGIALPGAVADGVVIFDRPRFTEPGGALINPAILIEVTTPETDMTDRSQKANLYSDIESVRDYIIISSERFSVCVCERLGPREWLLLMAHELDETVHVRSLGCRLKLTDIYESVEFSDENLGVGYMVPVHR